MEIHQLKYFVAVAEVGSFGGGARRCHVAQPSLSQQIKKLENELGYRLFDRLWRSISLTEAGQALLPRARRILQEIHEAKTCLSEEICSGQGSLTVGAIPTMAPFLLPNAVESFTRKWPDCNLIVREDVTDNLVKELLNAEIDIAIMSTPVDNEAIEIEVLDEERLLLAAPCAGKLATKATIGLDDLSSEPRVLLDEVHCLGRQVSEFCHAMRGQPGVVCRATQISTMLQLVEKNLGIALVPEMVVRHVRSRRLVFRPLTGFNPRRQIALARRVGREITFLARRFIECLEIRSRPRI